MRFRLAGCGEHLRAGREGRAAVGCIQDRSWVLNFMAGALVLWVDFHRTRQMFKRELLRGYTGLLRFRT
jgi:hypothetical protein